MPDRVAKRTKRAGGARPGPWNGILIFKEEWLGDLDSNQGCPGQSREFYR